MTEFNALKDKLYVVWNHAGSNQPFRYVPMALNPGKNYSWGVWDRFLDKWVKPDEIETLSIEDLQTPYDIH